METLRFSLIGREDIAFGKTPFQVTLADGRTVLLSAVDVGAILSDPLLSSQIAATALPIITAPGSIAATALPAITATGSTTARSLADRFADVKNVRDYGAVGDGTTDDAPAFQAAINAARATPLFGGIVVIPPGDYRLDTALDLTNTNGVTLMGTGPMQTAVAGTNATTTGVATLRGNTGGVVIDTTDSQYITLKDFQIRILNTYSTPSTIGILMGRVSGSCQFHHYDNVRIYAESNLGVNSPLNSRVGIYNVAAEHWVTDRLTIVADRPLLMTTGNLISGFQSPYRGALVTATMTVVTHRQFALTVPTAGAQSPVGLWATSQIVFDTGLFSALSAGTVAAVDVHTSGSHLVFRGCEVEELPGFLNLNTSVSYVTIDDGSQVAFNSATPGALIVISGGGFTISSSRIRLKQVNGASQLLLSNAAALTVTDSILYLASGQGIGSNTTLKNTLLFAPDAASSAMAGTAASALLMAFDSTRMFGLVRLDNQLAMKRTTPAYAASVVIDASLGNEFDITATNGTAFTVANPTNSTDGQRITITIRNASGTTLGTVTWDTLYKLSAWTNPANGFSRSIDFRYNSAVWVQVGQTGVDVPN